jgi:hypothetical protein
MKTEPTYTFPESFLRSLCEDLEEAPAKYTRRAVNAIEDMCSRQNAARLHADEIKRQEKAAKAAKATKA